MVFNSISVAIFLSPDALKIITLNRNQSQVLPLQFPNEAVIHQEIINEQLLTDSISSFLQSTTIRPQETVLFLTSSLVYMHRLPQITQDIEQQTKAFYEAVPIDANKIAKKDIRYNNDTILTATNERFYQLVVNILEQLGWKILYVVPTSLFISQETEQNIDPQTLKKLVSNTGLLKLCNFLDDTPVHTHASTSSKTLILSCIVFLLLLLNAGALGLVLGKIPTPRFLSVKQEEPKNQKVVMQQTQHNTTVHTPTPTIELQKDSKIQILNGSGVAGLAASVSAELKDEGFTEIGTGNAARLSDDTMVEYTDKIQPDTLDAITAKLENLFENITATQSAELENADIVITTGKRK